MSPGPGPTEIEGLRDDIAQQLRAVLLPGRRTRITPEVEAWTQTQAEGSLTDGTVLETYNASVDAGIAAAKALLSAAARDPVRRQALIGLLNRQGTSDQSRILVLESLKGALEPPEVQLFARVSVNQRPAAVPATLNVLVEVATAESAFVLRRVFGKPGSVECDEARAAAHAVLASLSTPAELYGGEGPTPDARKLLFTALALEREEQANLRSRGARTHSDLLVGALELDDTLVSSGRTAAGLTPYESLLRAELHTLVVLVGLTEDRLLSRAMGTLFLRPSEEFEELAPLLTPDILDAYFTRAVTPDNVRKSPERARAAARALRHVPPEAVSSRRPDLRELLRSRDLELSVEAAITLMAAGVDDRAGDELQEVVGLFLAIDTYHQRRLAPLMGGAGPSLIRASPNAVGVWAAAAPLEEVPDRCGALLERWAAGTVDDDDAAELAGVSRSLLGRAPPEIVADLEMQVVKVAVAWLRSVRTRASALEALAPHIGDLLVTHADALADELSPSATRKALRGVVNRGDGVEPRLVVAVLESNLELEVYQSTVQPELVELAMASPAALSVAVESDAVRRRLLTIALLAHARAAAESDQLERRLEERSAIVLVNQRDRVIAALDAAERESHGNQALIEQLGAVRRALQRGAEISDEPSGAVKDWRRATASAFPNVVSSAHDGSAPLEPRPGGAKALEALDKIVPELDRRAHSRGVAPAADRTHYKQDLARLAPLIAEADASRPRGARLRRSPQLEGLLLKARAANVGHDVVQDLSEALCVEHVGRRGDFSRLATLAADATPPVAEKAASCVGAADLPAGLERARTLLLDSVGRLDRVRRKVDESESTVMREIAANVAVPFQAIESYLFGYFRLRQILVDSGWGRATPHLGEELDREEVHGKLDRLEVRGEGVGDTYMVRSLGITVNNGNTVVSRAIVEPTDRQPRGGETQ